MQGTNYDLQYSTRNNALNDQVHQGYKTQNSECEISANFPTKPPTEYQKLFDFRMQLLLLYDTTINSGETRSLPTTCTISPNNGWFLSMVANPALSLVFHEQYISPFQNTFRVHVSVTNTSSESKHLPPTLCIGYLLLKCD